MMSQQIKFLMLSMPFLASENTFSVLYLSGDVAFTWKKS